MSTPILLEFGDSGQSSSAIRQWGLFITTTISDEYTVSYPLAFLNQAIPVATKEDLKDESHREFIIVNFNTKYFTFATEDNSGIACLWIAIGF